MYLTCTLMSAGILPMGVYFWKALFPLQFLCSLTTPFKNLSILPLLWFLGKCTNIFLIKHSESEGDFFKLWESERKINRPEHTAGGSQNKGTEKLQRRAAPSPLEEGGGGRGKGQTQPQRSHPLPPGKQAPGPV